MTRNSDETTIATASATIESAHQAYLAARDLDPGVRAQWLRAIADGLIAHSSELVAIAVGETHLSETRLSGELVRTAFQLGLLADEIRQGVHLDATIDHADPNWGMGPRPDIRRVRVPLGVVGVFGASNFPFAFSVIGGDSAAALAAGCAVVHKSHGAHPRLADATAEIVIETLALAGAPAGLFATVTGRSAAEALVDHPLTKAIGFTGSTPGGRALFDRAAARPEPIPFFGELGSINPVFVTESAWQARRDDILSGYVGSFTLGMGQFCTKPGLLFVPSADWTAVGETLTRELSAVRVTPMLSEPLRHGFGEAVDENAQEPGVLTLVAGSNDEAPGATVFGVTSATVRSHPEILRREMFGPASVVVSYETADDLVEIAGLLEGQLTSTIQTDGSEDLTALLAVLRDSTGRILWNAWPTGVTVSYAQHHGGPYPASTNSGSTSVGTAAITRFMRPVAFQGFPADQLPPALRDDNPWNVLQRVDGQFIPAHDA